MNKKELRAHLKELRLKLPETERQTFSQQICRQLEALDWSEVHSLHCFEPIAKLNEVDITNFIAFLQTAYPNIQLYTSRQVEGMWKVVNWQGQNVSEEQQFDVVVVPMLGFDSQLHRIGYGGGYYDRFLATQKQSKKIGVCFELGKTEQIPHEPHDVPLDKIVTEANIY